LLIHQKLLVRRAGKGGRGGRATGIVTWDAEKVVRQSGGAATGKIGGRKEIMGGVIAG